MTGPRIGELFAGYGGLGMGVQAALGGEIAWVSEYDAGPSKILAHRFPGVPNHGDITKIDWATVEPVDILTGGSPCQDLSHAGRRAGMTDGTRSNLWVAMREAIAQLRPSTVVWENVRGAFSAAADSAVEPCPGCVGDGSGINLRALGRVLGDLSDLGYDTRWHGLRASDVGAPHGRFRVFVVATDTQGNPRRVGDGDGGVAAHADNGARHGERARSRPRAGSSAHLLPSPRTSDTNGAGQHGSGGLDLRTAVTLLPTPRSAADRTSRSAAVRPDSKSGPSLGQAVELAAGNLPREFASYDDLPTGWAGLLAPPADATLLPTPRASDGAKGGPNQRGSSGDLMLPSAVHQMLPTPRTQDAKANASPSETNRKSPGIGAVSALLPTPMVGSSSPASHGQISGQWREQMAQALAQWGDYAPAVQHWAEVLERPAPDPTKVNTRGNPQLAPSFVEWMMGLPAGWVTEVPGITRTEALKALGNGVVPQQAEAAIREVLSWVVV